MMNYDEETLTTSAAIFSCSHRAQGNSVAACNLFQRGVEEAGGDANTIYLRKIDIKHCSACRICEKDSDSKCVFDAKDYTKHLFDVLFKSPVIFFASPIYFYHLPSRFKAFIDRSQQVWAARQKGDEKILNLPHRKAYACLIAGRDKGEKHFEASQLTMKYFLENFNIELADVLTLPGKEKIGDLEDDKEASKMIIELGKKAWEERPADKED